MKKSIFGSVYVSVSSNRMNKIEIIQIINQLVAISVQQEIFDNQHDQPYKSFGIGEMNVSFVGLDALSIFQAGLKKFYSYNKDIEQTISLKKFEASVIELIRSLKQTNRECTNDDIEKCFSELLKLNIIESEILYELYGAELNQPIYALGKFTIYNYSLAKDILHEKYPSLKSMDVLFENSQSNIFLGLTVKARENNKAVEIADSYANAFENIMNFMISDLSHQYSIGVFNFRGWQKTDRIIFNVSGLGFHVTQDLSLEVNISDPFLLNTTTGNDKIWSLITKIDKSEIEKRLLQSIEWIGKGIHDTDKSKALVQFVFAVEVMLKFDEEKIIIPSIVSQLSDWLAFIIHEDHTMRIQTAKYFKQIYTKRSAIVHGGSKIIDDKDLQLALQIAKQMVYSFLSKDPFNKMSSMKELSEYMTELKFN